MGSMAQVRDVQEENDRYPLPLFIFLSLLTGWVILPLVIDPASGLTAAARIALPFLLAVHLIAHWRSIAWIGDKKRWLLYAAAQSLLVFAFSFLSGNPSVWSVLFIWLIGETIGLLDRPGAVAMSLLLYGVVGIATLFVVTDQETALSWLGAVLPTATFVAVIVVLYKRQVAAREEAQRLVLALEAANRQIADYAERVELLTLANERQRLARELHDTLAQGMAGLVLQLEATNSHLAAGRYERAQTIVQDIMARARVTLADARAAIDDLRTREAPARLDQRVEKCCRRFQEESGLACHWQVDLGVDKGQLTFDQQEQLERILSEALANVRRHAQATAVQVDVAANGGTLTLHVRDNGRGFDLEQTPDQGHYGLRGLRERARILAGTLEVNSAPGAGTTILLTIPLRPVAEGRLS